MTAETRKLIREFITVPTINVESTETVEKSKDLMQKHGIRHLPVMDDGVVVGVLSDRDVKLVYGLRNADVHKISVIDVCITDPYKVDSSTPVYEVAKEMVDNKYGCTLVTEKSKIIGIFTTTDACRALAILCEK